MTKHVPNKWREHVKRVETVNQWIQTKYGDIPDVESVGIAPSDKTVAGRNGLRIVVGVKPDQMDSVNHRVPDEIQGIDIDVEKAEQAGPA